MPYPIQDEDVTPVMPLTLKFHALADQFRQQQFSPQKAKQVYLNTLAVQAVSTYFNWLGIETDLEASDSWNPAMQALTDTADIVIPGKGRLECCPILPNQQHCLISPEVWGDRLGYIAVQLNSDLSEATLLGFVPVATSDLPLDQLRSLNELLDHLDQVDQYQLDQYQVTQPERSLTPIKLGLWLQNVVEVSWQTLEELLNPQQLALGFRGTNPLFITPQLPSAVTHGKLLDLSVPSGNRQIALLISVIPTATPEVDIWVTTYAADGQTYLPPDLELMVLDEVGNAVMQAQSRSTDLIQLKFKGMPEEHFSVKVVLSDFSLTEFFVI